MCAWEDLESYKIIALHYHNIPYHNVRRRGEESWKGSNIRTDRVGDNVNNLVVRTEGCGSIEESPYHPWQCGVHV